MELKAVRHKAALKAFKIAANGTLALSGMEFFIVDYDFLGTVSILFVFVKRFNIIHFFIYQGRHVSCGLHVDPGAKGL